MKIVRVHSLQMLFMLIRRKKTITQALEKIYALTSLSYLIFMLILNILIASEIINILILSTIPLYRAL